MTRFNASMSAVLLALAMGGAGAAEPQSATLAIEGMTCASCPITVKKVLKKITGVTEASVDYKTGEAKVRFDPEKVQPEQLARAVTGIGFPATVKK